LTTTEELDAYKRAAAARALDYVHSRMRLGLGSGSTARHFVELLGERVQGGLDVICVPTSEATRRQAEEWGISLSTLDETPELDLTVDGADEIAPDLSLIKGGGGALLREKIVASVSARMVVIADHSKLVPQLGGYPLPIEVVNFGFTVTQRFIETAAGASGCHGNVILRRTSDGQPYLTDSGHFIFDAALKRIPNPATLAARLAAIPGVVEHGLFIGMADVAIVAGPMGVEIIPSGDAKARRSSA
jgi:ribose 5-phosphate isomerase A